MFTLICNVGGVGVTVGGVGVTVGGVGVTVGGSVGIGLPYSSLSELIQLSNSDVVIESDSKVIRKD